jgi:zinc transport system substrate-binding protein
MKRLLHLLLAATFLVGCDPVATDPSPHGAKSGSTTDRLTIVTSLYPAQYFAQQVGGDLVEARCPVPPHEDPIFWMPDDSAIQQYQSADLIVLNGAHFAKWVEKVTLPHSKIVNTALPLKSEFIRFETAVEHSHGKTGKHSHEGIDGHTWLDPINAKVQAAEIRNALLLRLPHQNEAVEANYAALSADLDDLDKGFRALRLDASTPILCSHPAYNYLARRYGWNIHNLDLDPAGMPSDETFAEISEALKTHPAKHILWESDPLPEIAERFENDLGVRTITISPCELLGENDYLVVMKRNIERLKAIATP